MRTRRPARPALAPVTPIGRRLEAVRVDAGIPSQRAFWQRLAAGWRRKVSYEAVRNYHYNREPSVHYLARVAKVFDVRLEYLVDGTGEMRARSQRIRGIQQLRQEELTAKMQNALGRPPELGVTIAGLGVTNKGKHIAAEDVRPRPLPPAAPWAFPLLDLVARVWDREATLASDAERALPDYKSVEDAVIRTVAAPLRSLHLGWDDLSARNLDVYIMGMTAVLSGAHSSGKTRPAAPAAKTQKEPARASRASRR